MYVEARGRRTFTHRTFTHRTFTHRTVAHQTVAHRTVAHRTFTHRTVAHRTVAHRTVAHLILHAYLILKRVLLANSTFIWYFNANRTHGCVERIVSVTGSACLPVCDAVLPKRAAVNQPILLDFFTDQIQLSYIWTLILRTFVILESVIAR